MIKEPHQPKNPGVAHLLKDEPRHGKQIEHPFSNHTDDVDLLEKQIKRSKRMPGGVAAIALAALIGVTVVGVGAYTGAISPESIRVPF